VQKVAKLLGLEDFLDRKPANLSGGQRQRVAMGRAIIREPKAFLMDEPLSNLDAKLRVGMRASLTQLHARLAVTSIYVTHDQTEAMTLGHRVAVMRDGRIVQVDVPQRLYQDPKDLFVATFTLVVVQAIWVWNELLIALLFLQNEHSRTLMAGLTQFQGRFSTNVPLILAGALLSILPVVVVYLSGQRFFVRGLTAGIGK